MKKILISALVVFVLIIGGYFILGSNKAPTVTETNDETQDSTQTTQTANEGTVHEVIYSTSGYAPNELTIKVGDTVTFRNQSSSAVWTASAMHPSHTAYSGNSLQQHCPDTENTAFDQCESSQPGESWSFTFTKASTWGYHNHVNGPHFGKIIVTE